MNRQLEALRHLYDAGAFLRCAKPDKTPIGKVSGEHRRRSCWGALVGNLQAGGHVLYYQPGAQGILILDFDPAVEAWLDSIQALLEAPAHRLFESSGKWKEATGDRPEGKGGHATWTIDPTPCEVPRQFSDTPEGQSMGEAFAHHPGFGVVVWDAVALADTMELDPFERVDPTRLHRARYALAQRNADGSWTSGEGSRHDAAISEICKAALTAKHPTAFEACVAHIKECFEASFECPTERAARMRAGEWDRIEALGRRRWAANQTDNAQAEIRHNSLITAIRKGKRA